MLFEKIELEEGEVVLKTVRKHWFIIGVELFFVFVMLLVPFIALTLYASLPTPMHVLDAILKSNAPMLIYAIAGWMVLTLLTGFTIWTHYFLDLWLITDRRIIVIDQVAFFSRKVSNFRLERLQDIKVFITGIIPTLLNFGTLRAQTASAAESNFKSSGLPDPRGLQAIIQGAMDKRLLVINQTPAGRGASE